MTETVDQHTGANRGVGQGFTDTVGVSQAVFRAVMDAMARPGSRHHLPASLLPPAGLAKPLAALALALADFETPVWLDNNLSGQADVVRYLKFFTGAPLTADPEAAAFALVSNAEAMPMLADFAQGSPEYPDRSTTVIVLVDSLDGGKPMLLRGPGINGTTAFAPRPVPPALVAQLAANRAQFPLGVDLVFAATDEIAAVPRSLHVIEES